MATKQPDDKSHFILPDLGEGVHEAELISWKVAPGDTVAEHQTLAEMETDKALVEVPSPWAGVIKDLCGKEGDIMIVGKPLVTYDIGGDAAAAAPAPAATATAAAGAGTRNGHGSHATATEAPAEEEREDAGTVVGSVGGTLTVSDRFARRPEHATAEEAPRGKALATPAVRRVARELGVDINRVPATGRGGRVTASDVQAFAEGRGSSAPAPVAGRPSSAAAPAAASAAPPVAVAADGVAERIPFRGVRRTIAAALQRSVQTAVHFTVVDEVDVTALDAKRREYAAVLGRKLSFLPFVLTAVCRGLRTHPQLNALVDDEAAEILRKAVINLGIAVDTDHGLMVPVIRDADRLGLAELGDEVARLASGCRDRSVAREELTGSTFTISNVGSYGGMFATPVINYPEVGILAVGRAYEKVLVRNGAFYAGTVMPLSLSCDHRVVDGAEGARFLNTVKKLLEDPGTLLGTR
ncbi:MAG: dihydrolipoamide acetyltransferase family protein [Planctomycetota bacterium]|jgi:pyruvate dehydrogenase E2 component (dihydrolipoamide acetyltransferase)